MKQNIKKIGEVKVNPAKNLYKEGGVLTVPFKIGKNLQVEFPIDLASYLKLSKKKKLYVAIVGGTLQLAGNEPLITIPLASNNPEDYISHKQ